MSRSIAPKTIGILTKLSYPSLSGWRIMAWGWHTDTHTDRQTQATIPKGQNWPWVITFTKSHLQFGPFCSGFKSMLIENFLWWCPNSSKQANLDQGGGTKPIFSVPLFSPFSRMIFMKSDISYREINEQSFSNNPNPGKLWKVLTHWGQATHICVGDLTITGSDNGLSPGRRQAII